MTRYRRWDGVAVLAAAAAIGLTACSGTSAPHVANLGRSRGGDVAASTSTVPAGSPTQLLDEWASCMRGHGDPNQVDPTVDATKVIQVTLPAGYAGGLRGGSGACGSYLSAAETALGGGTPTASSSDATGLRFAAPVPASTLHFATRVSPFQLTNTVVPPWARADATAGLPWPVPVQGMRKMR